MQVNTNRALGNKWERTHHTLTEAPIVLRTSRLVSDGEKRVPTVSWRCQTYGRRSSQKKTNFAISLYKQCHEISELLHHSKIDIHVSHLGINQRGSAKSSVADKEAFVRNVLYSLLQKWKNIHSQRLWDDSSSSHLH